MAESERGGQDQLIAVDARVVGALEDVEGAADDFARDPVAGRDALCAALGELVGLTDASGSTGANYPSSGALGIAPAETFLGSIGTGGIVTRVPVGELRAAIDIATAADVAVREGTDDALDELRGALEVLAELRERAGDRGEDDGATEFPDDASAFVEGDDDGGDAF